MRPGGVLAVDGPACRSKLPPKSAGMVSGRQDVWGMAGGESAHSKTPG